MSNLLYSVNVFNRNASAETYTVSAEPNKEGLVKCKSLTTGEELVINCEELVIEQPYDPELLPDWFVKMLEAHLIAKRLIG